MRRGAPPPGAALLCASLLPHAAAQWYCTLNHLTTVVTDNCAAEWPGHVLNPAGNYANCAGGGTKWHPANGVACCPVATGGTVVTGGDAHCGPQYANLGAYQINPAGDFANCAGGGTQWHPTDGKACCPVAGTVVNPIVVAIAGALSDGTWGCGDYRNGAAASDGFLCRKKADENGVWKCMPPNAGDGLCPGDHDCCSGSGFPVSGGRCGAAIPVTGCVTLDSRATDQWCVDNCNHNPPHCPADQCRCGAGPVPVPVVVPGIWTGMWACSGLVAPTACDEYRNGAAAGDAFLCRKNTDESGVWKCMPPNAGDGLCPGDHSCCVAGASRACWSVSSSATNQWCMDNCNHVTPNCPPSTCQCGYSQLAGGRCGAVAVVPGPPAGTACRAFKCNTNVDAGCNHGGTSTDQWCTDNCCASTPYCPASHCTCGSNCALPGIPSGSQFRWSCTGWSDVRSCDEYLSGGGPSDAFICRKTDANGRASCMPALGDGNCPSDYHCCSSSSIIPALGLQCTAAGQQSNTGGGHGYSVRDLVANEGQDVGTGSASNVPVDQCAARCDATPGCLSFAHRTDDNACWPKTQCVGSGDPNSGKLASEPTWKTYYKPGCSGTTGPPVAAGTVVPPGWVPVGFGWPNIGSGAVGSYLARRLVGPEVSDEGQELGGSTDASLDDCKRLCDQTSGCKSFSYSPNYRDCWVKDKCVTTADPDSRKLEWESHWMTYYKGSCTKTKPPAVVKKVLKLLQKASVLRLRLSRLFEKLLKLLRRKIPGITERQLRIAIADAVTSRHAATLQNEPNEAQVIMWVRSPNDGLEQGDLDSATNDALGDDEAKREVEDAAGGQWVSTQTASAGHPGQEAAEEEEDDESLETWQIVLIVVLIVLCICIVIIALVVISKRKKAAAGDQGAQKREAGEEMGKAGSQQEPEGVGSPATATEDAPLKQSKKAKDQPWQHPDEPVAGKLGGQTGPTESQQHASQQPRANDYQQPPSAAAVGGATGPTGDSTYESGATGYTELGMIPDPAGTRVWALYGDQYYGGEVVERQANGMYTVNWDDGTHSFDVQGETLRTR